MGKAENAIEKKLCDGVKALGGKAYKLISPGNDGMPDRLVCLPNGRVLFAELKTESGKLSQIQQHRIEELKQMGQNVQVLYGKSDVYKYLDELKKEVQKNGI